MQDELPLGISVQSEKILGSIGYLIINHNPPSKLKYWNKDLEQWVDCLFDASSYSRREIAEASLEFYRKMINDS